jgi:hypothetical protein
MAGSFPEREATAKFLFSIKMISFVAECPAKQCPKLVAKPMTRVHDAHGT